MRKINGYTALLFGLFSCSFSSFLRDVDSTSTKELESFKEGLTLEEIEERHRTILQNKPDEEKRYCNGFAYDSGLTYTARHCLKYGAPMLEDGTELEEIVSSREGDVSLLSSKQPLFQSAQAGYIPTEYQLAEYFTHHLMVSSDKLPPVPLYQGKLKADEEVTFFVKTNPNTLEEFIREYPTQTRITMQGLLAVSGKIISLYSNDSMLDSSCRRYNAEEMYVVDAPGRLGFSGSPVFVERERKYLLAGILVAVGMKGKSYCQSPPAERDTIVFSGIDNLFSLEVKMAQNYPSR